MRPFKEFLEILLLVHIGMFIPWPKKSWITKSETSNSSFNNPKLCLGHCIGLFNLLLGCFIFLSHVITSICFKWISFWFWLLQNILWNVCDTRKEDVKKTTPVSLLRASLKDQGKFLRFDFLKKRRIFKYFTSCHYWKFLHKIKVAVGKWWIWNGF